ncbi:MAG: DUF5654 family protein [Patescibacteria group bacterium]
MIDQTKQVLVTIDKKTKQVSQELKKKTLGYILAGLGLVVGLAWNEAIKTLIEHLFPAPQNSILGKFVYAVFITALLVVVGGYLLKEEKKN